MPSVVIMRNPERLNEQQCQRVMDIIAETILHLFDDPQKPGGLKPENITVSPGTTRENQVFDYTVQILVEIKRTSPHAMRYANLAQELAKESKKILMAHNLIGSGDIVKVGIDLTDMVTARA